MSPKNYQARLADLTRQARDVVQYTAGSHGNLASRVLHQQLLELLADVEDDSRPLPKKWNPNAPWDPTKGSIRYFQGSDPSWKGDPLSRHGYDGKYR